MPGLGDNFSFNYEQASIELLNHLLNEAKKKFPKNETVTAAVACYSVWVKAKNEKTPEGDALPEDTLTPNDIVMCCESVCRVFGRQLADWQLSRRHFRFLGVGKDRQRFYQSMADLGKQIAEASREEDDQGQPLSMSYGTLHDGLNNVMSDCGFKAPSQQAKGSSNTTGTGYNARNKLLRVLTQALVAEPKNKTLLKAKATFEQQLSQGSSIDQVVQCCNVIGQQMEDALAFKSGHFTLRQLGWAKDRQRLYQALAGLKDVTAEGLDEKLATAFAVSGLSPPNADTKVFYIEQLIDEGSSITSGSIQDEMQRVYGGEEKRKGEVSQFAAHVVPDQFDSQLSWKGVDEKRDSADESVRTEDDAKIDQLKVSLEAEFDFSPRKSVGFWRRSNSSEENSKTKATKAAIAVNAIVNDKLLSAEQKCGLAEKVAVKYAEDDALCNLVNEAVSVASNRSSSSFS